MNSLAQKSSTNPAGRRSASRRDRLAAQRVLWRESKHNRVKGCGKYVSANGEGVQLRVTAAESGKVAGFAGLQTCGSVWSCPTCSARILATRQREIAQAVDSWVSKGGQVAMMTFTMKHASGDRLSDLWDALQKGWHSITAGRVHQAEKAVYGVETSRTLITECSAKSCGRDDHHGRRHSARCKIGSYLVKHVLPWLRLAEITHGAAGWHVHVHAVVFLAAGVTDLQLQGLYVKWWSRWNSGLVAAGVDGSLMVNTAKFFEGREVHKDVGNYVTKNTYSAGDLAGLEVGRSDLKSARFGNRTPFQILRDFVLQTDGPQNVERDAALWAVFEEASHKRRQMTWAHGARAILGLDDVEQTDDEIAAEEMGSADDALLSIPQDSWKAMIRVAGRRADLLDLAESPDGSLEKIGALLDEWGTEWIRADRS